MSPNNSLSGTGKDTGKNKGKNSYRALLANASNQPLTCQPAITYTKGPGGVQAQDVRE